VFVLGVGGSFLLACLTGYVLAPCLEHPAWLVLVAPLILVVGSAASLYCSTGALAAVALGLAIVVVSGLTDIRL
jgi:hypothetical protein